MSDKESQLIWEAMTNPSPAGHPGGPPSDPMAGNKMKNPDDPMKGYSFLIFQAGGAPDTGHWADKVADFDDFDDALKYAKKMHAESGEGDEWVEHGVQWDTTPETLEWLHNMHVDTIPELANAVAEWQFGDESVLAAVK